MSKLSLLMQGLKAFTVIIIENALQFETDPEVILAKFSLFKCNRDRICSGLEQMGHTVSAKLLRDFYQAFDATGKREAAIEKGAVDFFKRYISTDCGSTTLNEDEVLRNLEHLLNGDEADEVKSLFLKHGLCSIEEADYEQIIEEVSLVQQSEILFFRGRPPAHDIDGFFSEIEEICEQIGSDFCLAIVDKKLATGGADEEGRNFIIETVIPENEKRDKKIICCIYTSAPVVTIPANFPDYFIQEVGKASGNKLDVIGKTLTRSAYAQVFNVLKLQYQHSASNALSMVLKNQKNIKYILAHSIREGIPGFEAIKYWFNLAQQYQLEQEELKSLRSIAGIINFFDNQHLEDHPHIAKIGPELKELNSFELFDKNVNQKLQPISPGDIFQIGDDYYILMGQLCDIALRSTNTRKAKLGELLKLTFIDVVEEDDKYSIRVDDGRKSITIQNFPLEDDEYSNIIIDVSTDTTEFAELAALDIVMFNENGEAKLSIDKEKTVSALEIMPVHLSTYYSGLQDKYASLKVIKDTIQADYTNFIDNSLKFSSLNFISQENEIDLSFKRLARLKGRYFDSVYNNFLNNKGRIDLNLIDNSPEYATAVKLTCSFLPENDPQHVLENANLWLSKGEYFFKRDELIEQLPEEFKPLMQLYTEKISKGNHQYDLINEDGGSYSLGFKYYIHKNLYLSKKDYSYKTLFNENKPANNPGFKVDGDETLYSFMTDAGHPANPISLEQLKKGVTVYEKNVYLKLTNGILTRDEIEE